MNGVQNRPLFLNMRDQIIKDKLSKSLLIKQNSSEISAIEQNPNGKFVG